MWIFLSLRKSLIDGRKTEQRSRPDHKSRKFRNIPDSFGKLSNETMAEPSNREVEESNQVIIQPDDFPDALSGQLQKTYIKEPPVDIFNDDSVDVRIKK